MELNEALTGIVYHATRLRNAAEILKDRRFILNLAYGAGSEEWFMDNKQKIYYMSVTRNKLGDYHRKWEDGVVFVLNGEYFNRRYESKPVNYFAAGIKNLKDYPTPGGKGPEYEDRIYSDKPILPLILEEAIKEIHVEVPPAVLNSEYNPDTHRNHVDGIMELLKISRTIPVYWYLGTYGNGSNPNWRLLNKKGTLDKETLERIKRNIQGSGMKFARQWHSVSGQYLVPFGRRPGDWEKMTRADQAGKPSKLIRGDSYDPLYMWRDLYYSVKRSRELSPTSKTLINDLLRYYHSYGVSTYGDRDPNSRSWTMMVKSTFRGAFSDMRNSKRDNILKAQEKMRNLIKQDGFKDMDAFAEYIGGMTYQYVEKFYAKMNDAKEKMREKAKNAGRPDMSDELLKKYFGDKISVFESHQHQLSRHIIVYHGSNKKFDKFSEKAKRIANDFYGGGIAYTTTDKNVALTYSRAMTYRYGGEEYLYEIQLDLKNLFDVDTVFTGDELKEFLKYIKPEDFARSAGLLGPSEDKYSVLSKLSAGNLSLTGKQVFKGLSKGLVDSSGAESILKRMGYDSLRYNGGDNMGTGKHDVYIPYYENQIKIRKVFKVQRKAVNEDIGHLSFARATLPQVRDQQEFLDHIRLIGSDYDVGVVPAGNLKATQLDGFDDEKIQALRGKKDVDPVIISSDDFILDGHHRWLARKFDNKEVKVIRIYLPILELIRVAMDFYKVEYSNDITEMFAGLKPVLYHHLNWNKLYYSLGHDILEAKWEHEIPNIHVKKNSMLKGEYKRRKVSGNSLTRNPNLNFGSSYYFMLEFDLNKIKTSNKIHVIDGDLTFYGKDPHSKTDKPEYTRTRFMAAKDWKFRMDDKLDGIPGPIQVDNEFAEEFVEGDIKPLSKYLNAIWVKPEILKGLHSPQSHSLSDIIDVLATYAYDHNIPIKAYPSGKDITDEWIDAAAQETPLVRFAYGASKAKAFRNISHTLAGVRKSINTNKL